MILGILEKTFLFPKTEKKEIVYDRPEDDINFNELMDIYKKTTHIPFQENISLSDILKKEPKIIEKEKPSEFLSIANSYLPVTIHRDEISKMKVINQLDKKFIVLLYQNHL